MQERSIISVSLVNTINTIDSGNTEDIVSRAKSLAIYASDFGRMRYVIEIHNMYLNPEEYGMEYVSDTAYSEILDILWDSHPYQQEQYGGERPDIYWPNN